MAWLSDVQTGSVEKQNRTELAPRLGHVAIRDKSKFSPHPFQFSQRSQNTKADEGHFHSISSRGLKNSSNEGKKRTSP